MLGRPTEVMGCFLVLDLPHFPGASVIKNPSAGTGDVGSILGLGRSLEREMAIRFSILA